MGTIVSIATFARACLSILAVSGMQLSGNVVASESAATSCASETRSVPGRFWSLSRLQDATSLELSKEIIGRRVVVQEQGGITSVADWVMGKNTVSLIVDRFDSRWRDRILFEGKFQIIDTNRISVSLSDVLADADTERYEGPVNATAYPCNIVLTWLKDNQVKRWSVAVLPLQQMQPRTYPGNNGFQYVGWHRGGAEYPGEGAKIIRWNIASSGVIGPTNHITKLIPVYIDSTTPQKWIPYIRRGIESWNRPFVAAGLGSVVVAKELPGDFTDQYEDARYSILCWNSGSSSARRPCGNALYDPRSGEQLQFQIATSGLQLLPRYIVSVGQLDSRLARGVVPAELAGELIEYVAAHETGHVLGLRDGSYSALLNSTAELRSAKWASSNGISPSVMNYTRFNYIANYQSNSGPLVQGLGPVDFAAVCWAYADVEKADCGKAARVNKALWTQRNGIKAPFFHFVSDADDPARTNSVFESVPVIDVITGARFGLINLRNGMLKVLREPYSSSDPDAARIITDRDLLIAGLEQWLNITRPAANLIGGSRLEPLQSSEGETTSIMVPGDEQRNAMKFLAENAFSIPEYLLDEHLLRRAGMSKSELIEIALNAHPRIIDELFREVRISALSVPSLTYDKNHYSLTEFLESMEVALSKDGNSHDEFRVGLLAQFKAARSALHKERGHN